MGNLPGGLRPRLTDVSLDEHDCELAGSGRRVAPDAGATRIGGRGWRAGLRRVAGRQVVPRNNHHLPADHQSAVDHCHADDCHADHCHADDCHADDCDADDGDTDHACPDHSRTDHQSVGHPDDGAHHATLFVHHRRADDHDRPAGHPRSTQRVRWRVTGLGGLDDTLARRRCRLRDGGASSSVGSHCEARGTALLRRR